MGQLLKRKDMEGKEEGKETEDVNFTGKDKRR